MSVNGETMVIVYTRDGEPPKSIKDCIKVHMDTGAFISGVLACFCVDTCKSVYVKRNK